MSTYDEVKAELGAGPDYPSKTTFTKVFGYSKGTVIGSFDNKDAALKAGATTTEIVTDDAAFKAAQRKYRDFQTKITNEWYARIRAEHPEVNDQVFALAYDLAYERGHSYGYGEVEIHIDEYVDYALKIIAAAK